MNSRSILTPHFFELISLTHGNHYILLWSIMLWSSIVSISFIQPYSFIFSTIWIGTFIHGLSNTFPSLSTSPTSTIESSVMISTPFANIHTHDSLCLHFPNTPKPRNFNSPISPNWISTHFSNRSNFMDFKLKQIRLISIFRYFEFMQRMAFVHVLYLSLMLCQRSDLSV